MYFQMEIITLFSLKFESYQNFHAILIPKITLVTNNFILDGIHFNIRNSQTCLNVVSIA